MKKIYYFFCFFAISIVGISQHNHIVCGTDAPSSKDIEATQNFIINYQSNAKNLRPSAEVVYIPIKLHVVTNDAGDLSSSFFKSKAFNQSLAFTNAVYKKVNVQFFVTGSINYIKSTKLLNINIKSSEFTLVDGYSENIVEEELCRPHEIPNVINLFFVNNSTINGALGTSYAKLPNPISVTKQSSYRIVMTALAIGGYSDLKFPVLAHEIGHHFSLHHPFDAIGGKELVLRGTGSNCQTAGDLVCDTPADPYNDIPSNSPDRALCGELPPNYKDANGDIYKPDMTNIMTYYSNYCKTGFTAGQYERILAGLALRKTSSQFGKYDAPDTQVPAPTITGAAVFNNGGGAVLITIKDNSTNELGFVLERATSKDGEFIAVRGVAENITRFSDELENLDVKNIPTLYYRVKASNSKNAYSNVFEIATKPKLQCIPAINIKCEEDFYKMLFKTVKANNSNLNETFVPCPLPSNYQILTKIINMQSDNEYTIEGTVTNDIQAFYNVYAWLDFNRNGTFDANERIYATNYSATNRPPNLNFGFKLNTKQLSGYYNLRLRMGFVTDLRDACAGMPQGETVDIVLSVLGAYSVTAGAISTNSVCPKGGIIVPISTEGVVTENTKNTLQLSDNQGTNFKEILTTVEGTNLKATIPADTKAGTGYRIKVVSTNPSSESISPTALTIKAGATAAFDTKDQIIDQYKSADIKLTLIGDLPIKVTLSDGQSFNFNELSPTIKLSPNVTTEYMINSASNTCGDGSFDKGVLKILVRQILANEPKISENLLVFPNPTIDQLNVRLNNNKKAHQILELVDNKGIIVFQKTVESNVETISMNGIATGSYIVRIVEGKKTLSRRIVKVE